MSSNLSRMKMLRNNPSVPSSSSFCQDFRAKVQTEFPDLSQRDVAKKLGEKWETLENKQDYLERAKEDRGVYTQALVQSMKQRRTMLGSGEEEPGEKRAKKMTASNGVIVSEKENVMNKSSPVKEMGKPAIPIPVSSSEPASQSTIGVFSQEMESQRRRDGGEKERKKEEA